MRVHTSFEIAQGDSISLTTSNCAWAIVMGVHAIITYTLAAAVVSVSSTRAAPPPSPQQLDAVRGLLERVVGHGASSKFDLELLDVSACASGPNATGLCGEYEGASDGKVSVHAHGHTRHPLRL